MYQISVLCANYVPADIDQIIVIIGEYWWVGEVADVALQFFIVAEVRCCSTIFQIISSEKATAQKK